jgi:hypothetical protein
MTDETPGGDLGSDINPSEEFASFFFLAIDHGFDSIESGGGPLTPFAMTVSASGEKSLHRFAADRLEQGLEMARSHVAANRESVSKYAIAWDGYVTLGGKRTDAILVEAAERGDNRALLFCQRYRHVKRGLLRRTHAERIGNPALIERPSSRLLL